MNVLTGSSYRKWFLAGLCINILAAFFSAGYHHPDEHFQILEFANYKSGYSSVSQLAWEFSAQCRPALQPFIVYLISKLLAAFGAYDPFMVVFLLRLLTGIFAWYVSCRLVKQLLPEFTTEKGRQVYVWCSFLLWFIPYLEVRFSSENLSGLLFFLAVSILFVATALPVRNARLFLAGLLLGFSVFLRLQMGFALVGLGIWLLFVTEWQKRHWFSLITGGLTAIAISVVADYWLYGVWTFTPWNYFAVNIIEQRAAQFGVTPWWDYFNKFLQSALPPLSIVLLLAFLNGIRKKPGHVLSMIIFFFCIGHFMIGHKEMRFLFPALPAFIFLCCIGLEKWMQRYGDKKIFRISAWVLVILNTGALLFRIFVPAQETVKYYQYIYNHAPRQERILVALERSPYNTVGLETNFYKPHCLPIHIIQHPDELRNIISDEHKAVFFLDHDLDPTELQGYDYKRVYCFFPDWLLKFNPNDWQRRSNIWAIYEVQ